MVDFRGGGGFCGALFHRTLENAVENALENTERVRRPASLTVPTLVLAGSGSLARSVCRSLAVAVRRPTDVAVVARSAGAVRDICFVAQARAALSGAPVRFTPVVVDLADPAALTGALTDIRPDGALLCASIQSPWERWDAPSAWTSLLDRAGFGVTLPLHAELAIDVGRALHRVRPDAWFLNACFPDAVNPVLAALGVPVLAGIGNVAILAASLQSALRLRRPDELHVLGHHLHLHAPARPEDEALVWRDGAPVAGVGTLLAAQRAISRPELNEVTGHAAALLLRGLLDGDEVLTNLPGPAGRPGGYPVRIGRLGVALRLPPGLTEARAVELNRHWSAADGVVVDGDRVAFGGPAAAALRPHLPDVADGFTVGGVLRVAAQLTEVRERLRKAAPEPARRGTDPATGPATRTGPVRKDGPSMTATTSTTSANLLLDFYDELPRAIAACVDDPTPNRDPRAFSPGFMLPEPGDDVREFLDVATATWRPTTVYSGHQLTLLDLTGNPGTRTTKTFPSLLIVARAVEYIRRTGEPVMIFSPTSANKGTGLRDAVLRAVSAGLVRPDQLRIVTLAPASCRGKLRQSRLAEDPQLRALNPLLLYTGDEPEAVKPLGREFVDTYADKLAGVNVWYSLELRNYLVADTARAFFEQRVDPTDAAPRPRWHAHAVSSAFGLLGYHTGRKILEETGRADPDTRPGSLLVQHLGTPDMVLNLCHGDFDRANVPSYRVDEDSLLFRRDGDDPHFPAVTYNPDEVLDPTFYTHRPVTSTAMNEIIARHGGDGIVVSLAECITRYPLLRSWLAGSARPLPADFRDLREWSTVMAFTGVLNAIDRGLVPDGHDVVVHGSGSYTTADFDPLDAAAITPVRTVKDIADALLS